MPGFELLHCWSVWWAAHALCRAFLDGLLLQVCDSTIIGRVRSNVNSLLSAVSLTGSPRQDFTVDRGARASEAAPCCQLVLSTAR
jgi:hypothetical protein